MPSRRRHLPRLPRAAGPPPRWAVGLCARWRRAAALPDAGGASVELVIAVPLLLLLLMFIVQATVWMHGTNVAQAAATRALDAGRAYNGSATAGQQAGEQTLTAIGSGVLPRRHVTVTRTTTTVQVEVDATAATIVPGIHWTVRATAAGPVERFVPANAPGPGG